MADNYNQRIAIDTEGGPRNNRPLDVTITSSTGRTLYQQQGVPLNSSQYQTMQSDVMRIASGKTVVGHNVNADIQQIGKTPGDFTGTIDTQNMGSINHTSNRNHDPAEDARQAMNLANRK